MSVVTFSGPDFIDSERVMIDTKKHAVTIIQKQQAFHVFVDSELMQGVLSVRMKQNGGNDALIELLVLEDEFGEIHQGRQILNEQK